jgi:hypothetical protein
MAKTYVKASGGCSAPAAKNADEAKDKLGQMRFRQFVQPSEGPTSGAREAQIMIGHPNNSGLQMDQVTMLYVPAFFVNQLRLCGIDSLFWRDGRRYFDFGRSQYSIHLRSQWREAFPRRGQGHLRATCFRTVEGDGFRFDMARYRPVAGGSRTSAWLRNISLLLPPGLVAVVERGVKACSKSGIASPGDFLYLRMLSTVSAVTYRS